MIISKINVDISIIDLLKPMIFDDVLLINTEKVIILSISKNTFTVTRGYDNTTPITHLKNNNVTFLGTSTI